MNIFIIILLCFSLLGFIDKMFHLQLHLSDSFDKGILTMGSMALSIVGICSVGVTFIQNHVQTISQIFAFLPFDTSLIIGALLAPDMGGFSITQQLAQNTEVLIFNGVILSSILGQTISFQFPVFLSAIDKKEHPTLMKGFIIGIIIVPIGLIITAIALKMTLSLFLSLCLPIFSICLIITTCLFKAPQKTIQVFTSVAKIIQWLTYFMFFIAVLGIFFPQHAYADQTLVYDSVITAFKIAIIVSGSLVLSELIFRKLKPQIHYLANLLHINDISMIGLILSCATSLAILPLYDQMDVKGKLLNAAFSVSGAYVIGGQLGFISNVCDGHIVTLYMIIKLICGIISLFVMSWIYEKAITLK